MKISDHFAIGARFLGAGEPCFIIAEVGLAHDGSLGAAHSFIDAAAAAGADAVKFQTHIASEESTPQEQFRVKVFPQDETRYDYWQRTSFTEDQWSDLKQHAEQKNIEFLSTPFSVAAVQLLRRIGVLAWKIGSGETNNTLLLEEVALGKEPVFLSSGMSYLREVDASVALLEQAGAPTLLMQCTNNYPCLPEHLGLNLITEYQQRYNVPVGFSDHSGKIAPTIAAVTLGAKAIEVHVTWSKSCFGPDVKASLTFEELRLLVDSVRLVESAFDNPVNKDEMAEQMRDMRQSFTKGLFAKLNIDKGQIIEKHHIDAKKPCLGIPVAEYGNVIGKVATRDIEKEKSISWSDLD